MPSRTLSAYPAGKYYIIFTKKAKYKPRRYSLLLPHGLVHVQYLCGIEACYGPSSVQIPMLPLLLSPDVSVRDWMSLLSLVVLKGLTLS